MVEIDIMIIKASAQPWREEGDVKQMKATGVMHRSFAFADQGAIECIVRFRIYSCTIKRRAIKHLWLSSATR